MSSSLENLCRVPALVEILNHPHLKKEIFCLPINQNNFKERDVDLQRAVSEFLKDFHHVLNRLIPKHLIILIGFEMWKWAEYQKQYFGLSFEFSQNFIRSSFFTSEGLIDEEKAARELLMEPSLSNFLKYSIACQYFLEDIIPRFWKPLQKNERAFEKMLKDHKSRITMVLWSDYLKQKNSASTLNQKVIARKFKIRVFSYGLEHKNIAAVKFSLGSKRGTTNDKTEAKIVRKLVYKSFCNYSNPILSNLEYSSVSSDFLFRTNFLADRNIVLYFITLMNKRELKEFFENEICFAIVRMFLLWPYQNQFMDFAYLFFENFGESKYNRLMTQIIRLLDDKHVCESYNYRLLFKEFWIKSPSLKKVWIISSESGTLSIDNLIKMLFKLRNFTSDDLDNINLILENANSVEREKIFLNQGNSIFKSIIFSHNNFKLADCFLKNLDLNQETIKTFKQDFIPNSFLDIMRKQDINLVDKIFKWVVGSDDIDDFKEEIFLMWTRSNKIEYLFLDLMEETPFSFLNKIIKWFLKTDEKIKEWKNNIEFSPLVQYFELAWFDQLIKFRGHSHEEASVIKRQLLFGKLPEIARRFLNYAYEVVNIDENVFYLCSYEKEKLREFKDHLRSFYEDSIKQKMCLLCLNNNHVLGDGEEAEFYCQNHGTNGFITLNEVDGIFSFILRPFDFPS